MLPRNLSRLGSLMLGLLLTGCASTFEPRITAGALDGPRLPTSKAVQAGVEVSIEEYFSTAKSRRAFDADLGASGVLPILIYVENKSSQELRLQRSLIRAALNEEPLPPMYGFEAAETGALRNPAWNALVNTAAIGPLAMFFGVGTIAASASQTQKVNRQIEEHFERLELTDRTVKSSETAVGFVFFKVPTKAKYLEPLMLELTLNAEPVEDKPARAALIYRFALPPLSLR